MSTPRTTRVRLYAWPDGYRAMAALQRAVDDSDFDKQLAELVKTRASQLNGCPF